MRKVGLIVGLIFLIVNLSCNKNAEEPDSREILQEELQKILLTKQGNISVPGISAAVYFPNKTEWQGVTGDSYVNTPLTKEMLMGIGSNTKTFTAVMLLKLEEQQKLSLSDAIHKYLPDFKNVNREITIRQLLQHSSGLDEYFKEDVLPELKLNPTKKWSPEEILALIDAPKFQPDEYVSYSNTNYVVAGMIIEKVTGKSYAAALEDLILEPLNLTKTYVEGYEPVKGAIAHPWAFNEDWNGIDRTAIGTFSYAAGCLVSTPLEMTHWYNELFNRSFLSEESLRKMTSFKPSDMGGVEMGLGLFLINEKYWGHGGQTIGYSSFFLYHTDYKYVVSVMVNDALEGNSNIEEPEEIALELAQKLDTYYSK